MSHSESSLPEYLLIGLHLWYSGQVSLITFISQYGFGLVGFRIWLVVRTSRPDGPTTSQGFRLTLLVAGFHSSRSFLDLFQSVRSLPLCPSALLSCVLLRSLRISGPGCRIMNYDKFCLQAPSTSICPKHCADKERNSGKLLGVAETRRERKGMGKSLLSLIAFLPTTTHVLYTSLIPHGPFYDEPDFVVKSLRFCYHLSVRLTPGGSA